MKTCRNPYENACRTGVCILPIYSFHTFGYDYIIIFFKILNDPVLFYVSASNQHQISKYVQIKTYDENVTKICSILDAELKTSSKHNLTEYIFR